MKMLRSTALAALFLCALSAVGFAADKAASADVTLSGELVDMACYVGHGAHGADHAGCAVKCAEMGQPVGLLGPDGKVYLLVADHADASAFTKAKTMAGKKVEIQGVVASKDGINALTVHSVKTS